MRSTSRADPYPGRSTGMKPSFSAGLLAAMFAAPAGASAETVAVDPDARQVTALGGTLRAVGRLLRPMTTARRRDGSRPRVKPASASPRDQPRRLRSRLSVLRYACRKLAGAAVVILAVTAVTFVMIRLLRPESFSGDPRPLIKQLIDYLTDAFLHWDLGRSWEGSRTEVTVLIERGIAADVWLLLGGMAFGVAAGIAAGAFVAARPHTKRARALEAASVFFLCAPVYWVGLVLVLLFAEGVGTFVEIPFFATNRYRGLTEDPLRWLQSLLVPWVVLGLPLAAVCSRMTAAAMREVLHEDYIRTATAKGLGPRDVFGRHAVRAASSPVLSLAGVNVPIVVTNLVLLEQVFSVPGVYQDVDGAMATGDFPVLQGLVLVTAGLVVLGSLLADVTLALIDPRVRA